MIIFRNPHFFLIFWLQKYQNKPCTVAMYFRVYITLLRSHYNALEIKSCSRSEIPQKVISWQSPSRQSLFYNFQGGNRQTGLTIDPQALY